MAFRLELMSPRTANMDKLYYRRQEPTTIVLLYRVFQFEHHFGLRGREFERSNLEEVQTRKLCPGGGRMLKLRFDWCISYLLLSSRL